VAKREQFAKLAKLALHEAKLGNPAPLITRLMIALQHSTWPLSDDETWWIREALEATGNERRADNLREIEQMLITEQVEGLTEEMGKQEAAIAEVIRQRGRKRRYIFEALAAYRVKRG
jgi:hypothetical protein